MFIDLRIKDATKLALVRCPTSNRMVALHTICTNPLERNKIAVGGDSPYLYIYDLRRANRSQDDLDHKPVYYIDHFHNNYNIITSCAFNKTGDKLLISFNDDDMCVCRTDNYEMLHRYKGHRNKRTIKGCAWFGDDYVLSGSDDSHIYGWDVESEHIVCSLIGDARGIVNSLSAHPFLPILASSGLDHNVKIWEPTAQVWPQTLKGIKPRICRNMMGRKKALDDKLNCTYDRRNRFIIPHPRNRLGRNYNREP